MNIKLNQNDEKLILEVFKTQCHTVQLTMVRRGIIGVNMIGYVQEDMDDYKNRGKTVDYEYAKVLTVKENQEVR